MNQKILIGQTRELPADLGMEKERSNERSAMTLLALARLDASAEWADAAVKMYATREIMDLIRDHLGQDYATNMRETIRRLTLHQLNAGGIVEQNADQPDGPIALPSGIAASRPRYAPSGQAPYIDDADHAHRTAQGVLMASAGIKMPERGKAPDLIVWMEDGQWLFLMETCSTHGPTDVMRKRELPELFALQKGHIRFMLP